MGKGQENSRKSASWGLFIRSMVITVSAIMLILIGYFSAGYFFDGLVF